jgi:hypothetical protein
VAKKNISFRHAIPARHYTRLRACHTAVVPGTVLSACGPPSGVSGRLVRFWVVMPSVSFSAYGLRIAAQPRSVRVVRRTYDFAGGAGCRDSFRILLVWQTAAVRLTDCCFCFMGMVQLLHRFVSSFAPVHLVHWCNACTGSRSHESACVARNRCNACTGS